MPYCSNCGTEMAASAVACPQCGHPRQIASAPRPTEGNAIAALILGILGIVACPVVLSIPAIIVGTQARNKIKQNPELDGESMARVGVILGWIGVGLGLLGIGTLILGLIFSAASVGTLG